jgi:hypothetical protein
MSKKHSCSLPLAIPAQVHINQTFIFVEGRSGSGVKDLCVSRTDLPEKSSKCKPSSSSVRCLQHMRRKLRQDLVISINVHEER